MGASALKIIGVTRSQNSPFVFNDDLQPSAQNNAAFLAFMNEWHLTGISTGLITFFENLQAASKQVVTHLPK